MICPSLAELPQHPAGKTGWPWTEGSSRNPANIENGSQWPKVTIVTPSYNQAQFLEETIRSVLLQGYPNIEYIIMDGGSTDGSVKIIKKYAEWIAHWESEPDRGQSHAVNKGWARSTGEVIGWLNSDDVYTPGSIFEAVESLNEHPESGMVYSNALYVDEHSDPQRIFKSKPIDLKYLLGEGNYIPQPTVFLKKEVLQEAGFLDEGLHMVMDLDLWLRIILSRKYEVIYLKDKILAKFRKHSSSKTVTQTRSFLEEKKLLYSKIDEMPGVTREVQRMKSRFYGTISFQYAVLEAADRHPKPALQYFCKAVFSNPAFVARHPKAAAMVLIQAVLGWFNF